jgi:hypothetical protein
MDWLLQQRIHDAKMLHAAKPGRDFYKEWAVFTDSAYRDLSEAWAWQLAFMWE